MDSPMDNNGEPSGCYMQPHQIVNKNEWFVSSSKLIAMMACCFEKLDFDSGNEALSSTTKEMNVCETLHLSLEAWLLYKNI
jgi:hypothetical protein